VPTSVCDIDKTQDPDPPKICVKTARVCCYLKQLELRNMGVRQGCMTVDDTLMRGECMVKSYTFSAEI